MSKYLLTSFILLIIQSNSTGQQLYFAPVGDQIYQYSDFSYKIIGNVNDHIVIWKHFRSQKQSAIFIYDKKMNLEKRVAMQYVSNLPLEQIDFINKGQSFDAIFQQYTKNYYYEMVAHLNDKGELIKPVDTLQVLKRSKETGLEITNFIVSENRKNVALFRILSGDSENTSMIEFLILDENMHLKKRRKINIPINPNSQIGPFYIDNAGSMIFSETHHSNEDKTTSLTVFKVRNNTDSILSIVEDMVTPLPVTADIKIDEKSHQYLVYGLLNNFYKKSSIQESRSIFTLLLNNDLNPVNGDSVLAYNISGQLSLNKNKVPYFKNPQINKIDSGFIITCVPNIYLTKGQVSQPIEFTSISQPFSPSTAGMQLNVPGPPIYEALSSTGQQYTSNQIPTSSASEKMLPLKDKVLVIYKLDNEKHMIFLTKLTGDMEDHLNSKLDEAFIFYQGNNTHVIYPKTFNSKRELYSDAVINYAGKVQINPIILNHLNYKLLTANAAKLDLNSIIFPCVIDQHLTFVKVEYEQN